MNPRARLAIFWPRNQDWSRYFKMNERYLRCTVYCPDAIDLESFYNKSIGTGEWDNTRDESYRLAGILNSKSIKHWLDDGKWRGHDWNYWRDLLPHHLSVS